MSNKIKEEVKKITIPSELHDRVQLGVKTAKTEIGEQIPPINHIKKKWSLPKKISIISGAAVLLFGVFIGSAFISPTMAKVAAKLPYIGQYFDQKSVGEVIADELRKQDYQVSSIGASLQGKKEIFITIDGSEKYFNSVQGKVEKIAKEVLQSRNYNAYSVKVSRAIERMPNVDSKQQKLAEESEKALLAINEALNKYDFNILSLGVSNNKFERQISVDIPSTETRIDELKQLIKDAIKAKNIDTFPIKIHKVDMVKREQEGRWADILNIVGEDLLGKKEYKVTGLAYSVYPAPEVIFKTSVKSTDPNAKEFAKELEGIIEEFLKSEKMKEKVKGDSYTITIRSKDKKKLN